MAANTKKTPPTPAEQRAKTLARGKRKLLGKLLQDYHDVKHNEFANLSIEADSVKENVDRLYKFLEAQAAKLEAELDAKYGKK